MNKGPFRLTMLKEDGMAQFVFNLDYTIIPLAMTLHLVDLLRVKQTTIKNSFKLYQKYNNNKNEEEKEKVKGTN